MKNIGEILLFGFAMQMPVAMRVREFDKDFFDKFQLNSISDNPNKDLFGD